MKIILYLKKHCLNYQKTITKYCVRNIGEIAAILLLK
jgi:hypothetical protein